jgi:hypothetical protein
MRTPYRFAITLSTVLLATSACAFSSDGDTASQPPGSPTPTTPAATGTSPGVTASPSPSGGSAELPDDLRTRPAVAAAIADTAERAKVDPAEVVIAAWSPVTFTSGAMGCPQKGMSYTQSLVEGELLLLRVDSSLYQYHAPAGGPFTYCANPSADFTVGG